VDKIVITGATSFIGASFAEECLSHGVKVFAVVRPNSKRMATLSSLNSPNLVIVPCEMSDYQRLPGLVGESVDCFAHFSWAGTRGQDRLDECLQKTNYAESLVAYRSALLMGASLFLDAGSQAEYGPVNGLIRENTPCRPNTAYGYNKHQFFETLSSVAQRDGIRYLHPRFFSVYGPGDLDSTMVMSTIRKMKANLPCDFTEAKQDWNYFYVKDLAMNLYELALKTNAQGVFNFGSATTKPLREFIIEMKEVLHSSSSLNFGSIPYPPSGCISIVPDIALLRKTILFVEKFSFGDGIIATSVELQ
jgi:UDP-glucose 4-epimerase